MKNIALTLVQGKDLNFSQSPTEKLYGKFFTVLKASQDNWENRNTH